MTREEAKEDRIAMDCRGWLELVDKIFDHLPPNLTVTEIFQKYGALEIRFEGEDALFEYFLLEIGEESSKICEKCGKIGYNSFVDRWQYTLCKEHFEASKTEDKIQFI